MLDPGLDDPEDGEDGDAAEDLGQHDRAGPAHGVPAVGQEPIGDADEDEDQAGGEGDVAQPVDGGGGAHTAVLELEIGPGGAGEAEGDRDEEDQVPLHGGEQATEHEADERPRDGSHVVDAETEATLMRREGVSDDGRRVGEEHGAADALPDAHGDKPDGAAGRRVSR